MTAESIFVDRSVALESPLGRLALGIVDPHRPRVAEGIARLLYRSIQDAREENGGHLPSWLVDDIERNYISPERVRTLWAETGHRFVVVLDDEIVATVHVAKDPDIILTVDRHRINVPAAEHPRFKPDGYHHVVNLSVKHELRRAGLGTRMLDGVVAHFRDRFAGDGLWVRADPPWHPGLVGLGFVHDPAHDVFLPPSAVRTAGLPHADLNRRYACDCAVPDDVRARRDAALREEKLQYVSFTRSFDVARLPRPGRAPRRPSTALAAPEGGSVQPRSVDELAAVLAAASREGRPVAVCGLRETFEAPSAGDALVVSTARLDHVGSSRADRITAGAGAKLEAVVRAADAIGLAPPVVTGWLAASVGGVLATGGYAKGSHREGFVADHVRALVVVTGDGRVVECSPTQAGWLFEAALGGHGLFGVIAEATLELAPRPAYLRVERREVSPADLAGALDDASAYHSVAFADGDRLTVVHAFAAERGTPFLDYVAPERPPARAVRSAAVRAAGLGPLLAELPPGTRAAIHPVRPLAPRLLSSLVAGEFAYVVSADASFAAPPPFDRARANAGRAARLRALVDPGSILV